MKTNKIRAIVVFFLTTMIIYSQKVQESKADQLYDNYAYVDAIKTYERIFEKGYKSKDMLEKLGDSYYFKADLDNAAKWYTELFAFSQEVTPEYYYRYAQSLKAIKEYAKADQMLVKFNQKSGNDQRGKLAETHKNYLEVIKKNSGRYDIEDAGINSAFSDYGSAYYKNQLIFATARDTGTIDNKKHSWTGEGFTNLYVASVSSSGILSSPEILSKSLNSKYNESTPVFTKDGNTVYFTRNNYLGKKGKDKDGTTLLKIYKATLENNEWKNLKELPFNSNEYSVAHPALSSDEKTLYFASDMPGSIGQSDLFKVKINQDGSFGTPENLGNTINTEGRETFPFVLANELYFASDGHPGLGGLDVFVSKGFKQGGYKEVINVGEPLNSSKDDFGYLINEKTRTGFVTSNREGGHGNDDIYKFVETKKLSCEQLLSGVVTDKDTKETLANAKLTLFGLQEQQELRTATTDDKGYYSLLVECGTIYNVRAEKEGYSTKEIPIKIASSSGKTELLFVLERAQCKVVVGDDLGKCFGIKMIYFDLDKFNVRKEAALELAKILDVLEQNPTMKLDIRSHTDCRQTAKYNRTLSDKRAKSTMAWLVKNNINASRLTGLGYGESQLVNNCGCEPTNESSCTEKEHQANRRSEFIITKL